MGNIVEIDNTGKKLKTINQNFKNFKQFKYPAEVERFLIKNSGVLWEVLMKH